MELNIRASRSFNDASAYPIFPWVINEYEMEYDINKAESYRNLSKSVGALNPHRLQRLKGKLKSDSV